MAGVMKKHALFVMIFLSLTVSASEWDGVTSDTAPILYQAFLFLLWVVLPLYVFIGWLRRRRQERRGMRELHRQHAETSQRRR